MKKTLVLALAAIMVLGVAGAAFAEPKTYADTDLGATKGIAGPGTVSVKATVNPKITLTVNTPNASQEVLFGAIDPDTDASKLVGLTVESNKSWDMAVLKGGDSALIGLTTTYEGGLIGVNNKGTWTQNDTYTINVPFTTDPGDYVATVQYTVTQK